MSSNHRHKKNLIVSMKNLSEELKNLFKEMYPEGYKEYIQKTIKPNGEPIFSVPMETEDTMYMVKVEMKIDTLIGDDDLDKDLYGDDKVEDSEFAPISEALEKDEENNSHTERVIKHGDAFEEFLMEEEQSKNKTTTMTTTSMTLTKKTTTTPSTNPKTTLSRQPRI